MNMAKDPKEIQFIEDKEEILDNLETLLEWLDLCLDGGMHDEGAMVHNQLLDLIDDTTISNEVAELAEIISQAKTIETDLDAWLSQKGRTTLSLLWPNPRP